MVGTGLKVEAGAGVMAGVGVGIEAGIGCGVEIVEAGFGVEVGMIGGALLTAYCSLLTTHYSLHTAHFLLHTAHCSILTLAMYSGVLTGPLFFDSSVSPYVFLQQ